ncbi:hypothetical protein SDC9_32306 [bioreactor metagenome]|uniref:B box-type domain-containing protein n=1 Tax=bioreactor metagenome TaxID=1076179 RepID=A0A644V4Q4_9ZZZZ|nr:hypothetical protein [Macellibacteroides fermentans]
MNCYEHPIQPAVAQCPDCGKGLCAECASVYSIPICKSCNRKRISAEKSGIIKELLLTFGIGILLAVPFARWTNEGLSFDLVYNVISYGIPIYVFSGIVPGWKTLTNLTPRVFLFLPIIGWVIYFIIKLCLSICIGLVMLPVRTVRNISRLIALQKIKA